jgi:predicted GIY-YIG superfamily endonuclease
MGNTWYVAYDPVFLEATNLRRWDHRKRQKDRFPQKHSEEHLLWREKEMQIKKASFSLSLVTCQGAREVKMKEGKR